MQLINPLIDPSLTKAPQKCILIKTNYNIFRMSSLFDPFRKHLTFHDYLTAVMCTACS